MLVAPTTADARATIEHMIGGDYRSRWNHVEHRAYYESQSKLSFEDRKCLVFFLYGNIRDTKIVYSALSPRLGNLENHKQTRRLLEDLEAGKYPQSAYLDVVQFQYYKMSGQSTSGPNQFVALLNAWDDFCERLSNTQGRYPTLKEQESFFSQSYSDAVFMMQSLK